MFRSNLLQLAAKLLSDAIASVKLEGNNHFDVQAVLVAEVGTDTKCRHTMDAIVGRNHRKNAASIAISSRPNASQRRWLTRVAERMRG